MEILIFHNANCGTSRNVVRTTTDVGYKPEIIKYLETGWSKSHLKSLFTAAGILAKEALRVSNTPAEKMGQSAPEVTQDQLLGAMVAHPILVNRPVVVCKNGVRLCRPSGVVLNLLDQWPDAPYSEEDGNPIIDATGSVVPGA